MPTASPDEDEGFRLNKSGRWADALRVWDAVIPTLDATARPRARMARAIALAGLGRVDEGLSEAALASLDAEDGSLIATHAGMLIDFGRPEDALRVAASGGHEPRALERLAQARLATGDPAGAADAAAHAWAGGQDGAAKTFGAALAKLGPEQATTWARSATWLDVGPAGLAAVNGLLAEGRSVEARAVATAIAQGGRGPWAGLPAAVVARANDDVEALRDAVIQVLRWRPLDQQVGEALVGLRHRVVGQMAHAIGRQFVEQNDLAGADTLIGLAVDAYATTGDPPSEHAAWAWWDFADVLGRRGDAEGSARSFRRSAEAYEAAGRRDLSARAYVAEARVWRLQARWPEAAEAREHAGKRLDGPSLDRFDLALETAQAAAAQGDRAAAATGVAEARRLGGLVSLDDAARADLAAVEAEVAALG